jgi:hypothetical protein
MAHFNSGTQTYRFKKQHNQMKGTGNGKEK